MLHVKSFRRVGPWRGSVPLARGIRCGGVLTRNEAVNRFKRARTGERMNGLPGMRGVKLVTGAAAAVLLMADMGPTPALADTIEAALVRAYQNNPQLNAQRAQVRSTDENVPQALSGYRPKVALTASAGYQYTDTHYHLGRRSPTAIVRTEIHGANAPRSAGLTVTQTLFNGQQTANRTRAAESQVSGAREAPAGARTAGAACGRHDLHGLLARFRHRRGSAQQRARSRTDAEADPRSLQCRRSDAHRRRAVGSAARRRQDPAADRRSHPDDDESEFPPHHRQRTGATRAGLAGRSLPAGNAARRGRSQPDRKSERHRRDVRHRRQLSSGQGQRRRAVADGQLAGLGAAVLRTDHDDLPVVQRFRGRAAFGAGLSGRRRILADPPVEGNTWRSSASISSRPATRPAPTR